MLVGLHNAQFCSTTELALEEQLWLLRVLGEDVLALQHAL